MPSHFDLVAPTRRRSGTTSAAVAFIGTQAELGERGRAVCTLRAMPTSALPLAGTSALITGGGSSIGLGGARPLLRDGGVGDARRPGPGSARRRGPHRWPAATRPGRVGPDRRRRHQLGGRRAASRRRRRRRPRRAALGACCRPAPSTMGPVIATPIEEWERVTGHQPHRGASCAMNTPARPSPAPAAGPSWPSRRSPGLSPPIHSALLRVEGRAGDAGEERCRQLGRASVRVTAFRPGPGEDRAARPAAASGERVVDDYLAQIPIAGSEQSTSIGTSMQFLCGPETKRITGQVARRRREPTPCGGAPTSSTSPRALYGGSGRGGRPES